MDDENRQDKLAAPYKGDEPYIFISYSHKDKERIMLVFSAMINDGYRVWFDEGIDPGTEWDQNIADHINACGFFIAFISSNYLSSDNCKDELNYARDLNKKRLLVYLEQVSLPSGMAMRLNRLQAIHYYTYSKIESFLEKLYETDGIKLFCNSYSKTFENEALADISKSTIEACECFANGMLNYRFLFLSGYKYKSRKALMSAIEAYFVERCVEYKLMQMEQFVNSFIEAIANQSIQDFMKEYEKIPYLILEDLDFLEGRPRTQAEIYHCIRHRYYNDKPTLIMASQSLDNLKLDMRLSELISDWIVISL